MITKDTTQAPAPQPPQPPPLKWKTLLDVMRIYTKLPLWALRHARTGLLLAWQRNKCRKGEKNNPVCSPVTERILCRGFLYFEFSLCGSFSLPLFLLCWHCIACASSGGCVPRCAACGAASRAYLRTLVHVLVPPLTLSLGPAGCLRCALLSSRIASCCVLARAL